MKLTEQQYKQIEEDLKEKGRFNIRRLGTFYKKNRRRGKIYGTFGSKPKYQKRIMFRPSIKLKENINE